MATRCSHLSQLKTDRPRTRGCHPIITSLEPGEDWSWCYIDQLAMELS